MNDRTTGIGYWLMPILK